MLRWWGLALRVIHGIAPVGQHPMIRANRQHLDPVWVRFILAQVLGPLNVGDGRRKQGRQQGKDQPPRKEHSCS